MFGSKLDPPVQAEAGLGSAGLVVLHRFSAQQCSLRRVYWIVGAAATINPTNVPLTFDGNILGQTSFTMSACAGPGGSGVLAGTINGCVFAETANTLAGETDINGSSDSGPSGAPEPGSAGLAAIGCLLGAWCVRRRRPVASRT